MSNLNSLKCLDFPVACPSPSPTSITQVGVKPNQNGCIYNEEFKILQIDSIHGDLNLV
jgi:hypothetical protein